MLDLLEMVVQLTPAPGPATLATLILVVLVSGNVLVAKVETRVPIVQVVLTKLV